MATGGHLGRHRLTLRIGRLNARVEGDMTKRKSRSKLVYAAETHYWREEMTPHPSLTSSAKTSGIRPTGRIPTCSFSDTDAIHAPQLNYHCTNMGMSALSCVHWGGFARIERASVYGMVGVHAHLRK